MKNMTITYEVGNALYINITNRCSNHCDFCIRNNGDGAYGSESLWLSQEPSREEILSAVRSRRLSDYEELVFCGYGEPTERLEDMIWVARELKKEFLVKIRVNTNGHSSLLLGRDTAPMYQNVIDTVSISLNAPNAEEYDKMCHSKFGKAAYAGLLDFAKRVKQYVPHVVLTVVDSALTPEGIAACREIAKETGVPLRVRHYIGKAESENVDSAVEKKQKTQ